MGEYFNGSWRECADLLVRQTHGCVVSLGALAARPKADEMLFVEFSWNK